MSDDKVRIPLLCCKVHETDVNQCIEAEFVGPDSTLTAKEMRVLGMELHDFLYANAPGDFLEGLLDAARVSPHERT